MDMDGRCEAWSAKSIEKPMAVSGCSGGSCTRMMFGRLIGLVWYKRGCHMLNIHKSKG